jgi:hypothetical protein
MRLFLRIAGITAAVLVAIVLVAFISINAVAAGKVARKYPIPEITVPPIPGDSASIARGRHIAAHHAERYICLFLQWRPWRAHRVSEAVAAGDREVEKTHLRFLGKALMLAGQLDVLVAEHATCHRSGQ